MLLQEWNRLNLPNTPNFTLQRKFKSVKQKIIWSGKSSSAFLFGGVAPAQAYGSLSASYSHQKGDLSSLGVGQHLKGM